ncbi:exodeoxyribonuclease V subunit gamma [Desertimonas flava]|uniref:exodeoxyribonuclease V subunit gamma n=1 Tax=Desertimonas flava TaxID=2064846 RepID=UPI0013C48C2A|nr:exodeoxyribonuclease V subunit gamma [Desertimonas flava]
MTLYVHQGNHLEVLADGLAAVFAQPLDDPFRSEVVAVPTAGVRDYLVRRLARRLGVSANTEMLFPGRFVARVLGRSAEADDPWHIDQLTWTVLGLLEDGVVEVPGWVAATTRGHSRRVAVARRIADLFDGYGANRPQVLQQWAAGAPGDGTVRDDGLVGGLDHDVEWQFHLWRAVRERIGTPSPAEELPAAMAALRADHDRSDLPSRVAWLGLASVAPARIELLDALATQRDVHLFVMRPSGAQWDRAERVPAGRPTPRRRADEDTTPDLDRNPLLRSWGRATAEMAALLTGAGQPVPPVDRPRTATTLLAAVQADIAADRAPAPAGVGIDRSLQVHACHGVTRQLEVLRDAIAHLLAADPTLQPHDVVVLCPDLARFEPFAAAVFSRGSLPVPLTVTDLSLGSENPVAAALAQILRVVAGRCTAVDLLDIATLEPVRQRLGLDIDDIDRITGWIERLGTSWGVDADQRLEWLGDDASAPRGVASRDALTAGTWEATLRALLSGVAMPSPSPRVVALDGVEVVPFDDMGADAAATAGRLAELVARLRHVRHLVATPRPVAGWCDVFVEALALTCATDRNDAWQAAAVMAAIDDLRRSAQGTAGEAVELEASDARTLLDGIVDAHHGRLRLRTGGVTMCGLAPMRNVPARVVCVLGFDEASLRPPGIDGDDLLGRRPCVGEPDRRGERRQFVLDALLAADDHFIVVCDGSDITTNRTVRFAVQLNELLDTADATLGVVTGGDADSPVVVRHPLRSYDEANFASGRAGLGPSAAAGAPFGFDSAMRHAAIVRRTADDVGTGSLLDRWNIGAEPVPDVVRLAHLVHSVSRPARTLLRDRLDLRLPVEVSELDTRIPLSVTPLEAASMGRRLLDELRRAAPADADAEVAVLAEWRRSESLNGRLPPGRLVDQSLDAVQRQVIAVVDAATEQLGGIDRAALLAAPDSVEVDLTLPVGATVLPALPPLSVRLVDTLAHIVHTDRFGSVVCRLSYTRARTRTHLEAAIHLAAAVAATGRTDWFAVSATRGSSGVKAAVSVLGVTGQGDEGIADARRLLAAAAEIHLAARRSAIPLFEETSRVLHETGTLQEEPFRGNDQYNKRADLADIDTAFIWDSVPIADILAMHPSPQVYADLLWNAVDDFVFDWSAANAASTRKGSR